MSSLILKSKHVLCTQSSIESLKVNRIEEVQAGYSIYSLISLLKSMQYYKTKIHLHIFCAPKFSLD